MNIIECEQGSPEWLKARAGKVTASRISDVLAKARTGDEAKSRHGYKMEIVGEILTGEPTESGYISKEMQYGIDHEPFARAAYEAHENVIVEQVGLVRHPKIRRAAASPDGLVSPDGIIEIKCPMMTTHLEYMTEGVAPSRYQPQMLWEMACTGSAWCDFVSYRHDLPSPLRLFVTRFFRDEARILEIEREVITFLSEANEIVKSLRRRQNNAV